MSSPAGVMSCRNASRTVSHGGETFAREKGRGRYVESRHGGHIQATMGFQDGKVIQVVAKVIKSLPQVRWIRLDQQAMLFAPLPRIFPRRQANFVVTDRGGFAVSVLGGVRDLVFHVTPPDGYPTAATSGPAWIR